MFLSLNIDVGKCLWWLPWEQKCYVQMIYLVVLL